MVGFLEANHSRSVATYSAGSHAATDATGATDVWVLQGSSSKIVRVQGIRISGTSSANTVVDAIIYKRSSPNSGGTSTTVTPVSHDDTNPTATATVLSYTANPTTLGSTVGILRIEHLVFAGTNAPNVAIESNVYQFSIYDGQTPALRGSSESFVVNLNGTAMATGHIAVDAQWTEE